MSQAREHDTTLGERLDGVVEKLVFHSEGSGFTVIRLRPRGGATSATVVGLAALVRLGDHVECAGEWVNDRVRGLQFRASQISIVPPTTLDAIEKYLCSGMVHGVGPHFAKVLIDAFGENVFGIIENEPERLDKVAGIGPKRREQIVASWAEQKSIRDIMLFLQSHGIGPARAVRIYKAYGDHAIEKVRTDPYALALDVHGIGFKIADTLASSLGIPRDAMARARAGVRHVLQHLASSGHCASHVDVLVSESEALLHIPTNVIQNAIRQEIDDGLVIEDIVESERCLYLKSLYRAETAVASHLLRLLKGKTFWSDVGSEQVGEWLASRTDIELSASQKTAVDIALREKVAVITGGPGVGKTTVVNTILQVVRGQGARVLLCAPTGRAAKRLSESSGYEAKTIHRLLEFDPQQMGFKRTQESPLDADFIIVDELSMVDVSLMNALLQAVPDNAALLMVGDADQLPSVGPGAVLADIIASGRVPTVRLTEIFRQAATSNIIVNAHRINQGQFPEYENKAVLSDFYFITAQTPDEIHDKLIHVVTERIPQRFDLDPLRDIQVLTPMNKGGLGTRSLNIELQKYLNELRGPQISRFGWSFGVGDKVIQTVNNYDKDVFNGDIGFINYVDAANGALKIVFDGREIDYNVNELDEVALAYATTIHKAQGSEYPAIVMPLSTQHYTLLERNLLYTGVTRGKSLVVIIGQLKALRIAVETVRAASRLTGLAQRLRAAITHACK